MCSNCSGKISVLHGTSLQNLYEYANSNSGSAALGRLEEILGVLQKNGGCDSCMKLIQDRISKTF